MIVVKDLKYRYRNSHENALKGISFKVEKGEIFGLLGPSGAGKTTTQHLLIGLIKNYSGSIKILGKERRQWSNQIYNDLGVGFEMPYMYMQLSAIENLKRMSNFYKKPIMDIDSLLKSVGLYPYRHQKVSEYSKGMKMRLNFIRALMHDPKIIFLDEPTSGLDPVHSQNIRELILKLKNQGKTVILTTHNMQVAEALSDQVALIHQGEITVQNTPKQLKLKYGKDILSIEYLENNESKRKNFNLNRLSENEDFQSIIKTKKIISMHSQEASLEQVFIELSGAVLK